MLYAALFMIAVPVQSEPSVWPEEEIALPLAAIDASREYFITGQSRRHFRRGDLSVSLRDGMPAHEGLEAVYRALPPRAAFHIDRFEKERVHKSVVNLMLTSTHDRASRTYAAVDGPLLITVRVFDDPSEVEPYFRSRTSGPNVSGVARWRSDGFWFGDDSWIPVKDPGSAHVRDGRVLTSVHPARPPSPERIEYIEALVQAVRFRLMVASGLTEGGGELTTFVRPGVKVQVRDFDGVEMVCLKELEEAGYVCASSADEFSRTCKISRGGKSIDVTEYRMRFLSRGRELAMQVAPLAYDGDLWLPLSAVVSELGGQ